jgi:MFS family permease
MNSLTTIDVFRRSWDESDMTSGRVRVILLVVLIAGLDGYDLLAMSFVAPVVSKAWSIDKATLGLVLTSSLFGMAGGSLGLSPLADLLGRRPLVLSALLLLTLGSLLSALSHAVWELAGSRALTGVGIGLMSPLTTTIAAEFANTRRRAFAVAATTVGGSLGGVAGGLLTAVILRSHAWLWVFVLGAALGASLFALTAFSLPESPAYLIDRWPANAVRRLNRVLSRIGQPLVSDMPRQRMRLRGSCRALSYRALFARDMAGVTIRLALVYILYVSAGYYLQIWLPQLVTEAGFPPSTASLVLVTLILVGSTAGLIFGALAHRIGPTRLASAAMIGFGASLALLGFVPSRLLPLMLASSACGLFLSTSTAVFYTSMSASFPPIMRVSGVGLVVGAGRLFSGLGPYLAGIMFAAGLTRTGVSLVFAAAASIAGLLLAFAKPAPTFDVETAI